MSLDAEGSQAARDQTEARRDVRGARLEADDYIRNFSDVHPPLTRHEAVVEADRCYFCYDAPCVKACPTSIDIPLFIRQILTGNRNGSAKTILDANIFGGMCARVCPTETLCEEVCVREVAEGKPVKIGLLQRYATDALIDSGEHPYSRAPSTGRRIAVVGAGPAGLACAHRLARRGHDVAVFEMREKPGGLNEYGIASYKATESFAEREVAFVTAIGGIEIRTGQMLGRDVTLPQLREAYDAVFLGLGLAGVNTLGIDGEDWEGVGDAVSFIADLRQADDLSKLDVGRRVVVLGGGMTAIDAATQARKLGAEEVVIVYRRAQEQMGASRYEQELAQVSGVVIRHGAMPVRVTSRGVEFEKTRDENGRLVGTGERFTIPADTVMKAIGQTFVAGPLEGAGETIELARGRIKVDDERRTSLDGVWAGGDCAATADDLTVVAVDDGQRAAESIHRALATKIAEAA